ncbi:unnamed protein product [Auanema sp. JU1783]|nr:unnamed protein product [Auanema sp. JU1783]
MFWNLVVVHYEKYSLQHLVLFILLLLYSYCGAVIFCSLESPYEMQAINDDNKFKFQQSVAAKKVLVEKIHHLYVSNYNLSDYSETNLRKAIEQYDRAMNTKPVLNKEMKWTIWGGLYYAGTIYTTIGYGDISAQTVGGRIFTVFYAILGIPLVITVLNDWGTLMFQIVNTVWKNYMLAVVKWIRVRMVMRKRKLSQEESLCFVEQNEEKKPPTNPEEPEPMPFTIVFFLLFFWVGLCSLVFAYFENWTFGKAVYFFLISLTTVGFGDITPSHKVAVINFILILGGLSIVSMFINVVQMQLEVLFMKVVKSIEQDFKNNLSISAEDTKKIATSTEEGDVDRQPSRTTAADGDAVKQFSQNMGGTEKLLMRFMPKQQRQMLNDKFEERARMRNKWTQTETQIRVASVQTTDRHEDLLNYDEEEEELQPHQRSRINAKRLYIYNTGE